MNYIDRRHLQVINDSGVVHYLVFPSVPQNSLRLFSTPLADPTDSR